jgi:hypothetical protein
MPSTQPWRTMEGVRLTPRTVLRVATGCWPDIEAQLADVGPSRGGPPNCRWPAPMPADRCLRRPRTRRRCLSAPSCRPRLEADQLHGYEYLGKIISGVSTVFQLMKGGMMRLWWSDIGGIRYVRQEKNQAVLILIHPLGAVPVRRVPAVHLVDVTMQSAGRPRALSTANLGF